MISFVAAGTVQESTGAITVPWPTHLSDDIALLICECEWNQTVSLVTANGFAAVTGSPSTGGSEQTKLYMFWCRATSSSMSSPITNDPGDHIIGQIITFRGCILSGDPQHAYSETFDSTSGALSVNGVTTTASSCMIVYMVGSANTVSYSSWANASLVSATEFCDNSTGAGNNGSIAAAGGIKLEAGATGAITATGSANLETQCACLALLEEPVIIGAIGGVF